MPIDEDYEFVRVPIDDPRRCEAAGAYGPCMFRAVEGTKTCPRHGAPFERIRQRQADTRLYLSAKWEKLIGEQADHPKAKSLGEDVGILRIMIKERLDQCKDGNDLIMASSSLSAMIEKVEKLVKTWHALEKDRGLLLDAARAQDLANKLVTAISVYIKDTDILQALAEDITIIFDQLNN